MNEADPESGAAGNLVAGGDRSTEAGIFGPIVASLRPNWLTARPRPVVLVLGMHRSGTSLLSNVLHYLGVDMADETDRASDKNPAGFWERPELVALHDEILEVIGRPVASPLNCLPFPAGWWRDKAILPFRARLRDYIGRHSEDGGGWWGFKDPRTCRLLPLWIETLAQMGIQGRYVWAIRSPAEAAASMAAKSPGLRPMPIAQAEMMWLAYNYDVLRYYNSISPIVVGYQEWFEDPLRVARRLVSDLGLPGFATETEFADCVSNIVQSSYRRHRDEELPPPSLPLVQWLYSDIASHRLEASGQDGNRLLENHVGNLDMIFRSIAPFVQLLDELPNLRDQVREAKAQAATSAAVDAQHQVAIAERDAAILQRDARLAALEPELTGRAQQINRLAQKLAATRSKADATANQLAAVCQEKETAAQELAVMRRDGETAARERDAARREADAMTQELAATRRDAGATAQDLAAARRDADVTEQDLAAARRNAAVAAHQRKRQKARANRLQAQIETLGEVHRQSLAELEAALADSDQRLRTLESDLEAARHDAESGAQALRERHHAEQRQLRSELDRLKGLDAELKDSERRRKELEIACEGYLARIETLRAAPTKGRR